MRAYKEDWSENEEISYEDGVWVRERNYVYQGVDILLACCRDRSIVGAVC